MNRIILRIYCLRGTCDDCSLSMKWIRYNLIFGTHCFLECIRESEKERLKEFDLQIPPNPPHTPWKLTVLSLHVYEKSVIPFSKRVYSLLKAISAYETFHRNTLLFFFFLSKRERERKCMHAGQGGGVLEGGGERISSRISTLGMETKGPT